MTSEFERGRIAGINEAVARLALWERASVGEEITFAEHAAKMVASLLPPVAPAGDREAVDQPIGAIVNAQAFANMVENIYDFECEAGPLRNCVEWIELRRCLNALTDALSRVRTGSEDGSCRRVNQ